MEKMAKSTFSNLQRTGFIYSGEISLTRKNSEGKHASLQFLAALCGFGFGPAFAEGERREASAARSELTPQSKGQLSTSGGEKNNGASARVVWKKDESGSLSISTACCHSSEPPRQRGGGER